MSYIDTLFGQHPFVYRVDSDYYCLGNMACRKLENVYDILDAKNYHDGYFNAVQADDHESAVFLIRKIIFFAKDNRFDGTRQDFESMNFSLEQLGQIEEQIEQYRNSYKTYIGGSLF